jgi:hypothetical protein
MTGMAPDGDGTSDGDGIHGMGLVGPGEDIILIMVATMGIITAIIMAIMLILMEDEVFPIMEIMEEEEIITAIMAVGIQTEETPTLQEEERQHTQPEILEPEIIIFHLRETKQEIPTLPQ